MRNLTAEEVTEDVGACTRCQRRVSLDYRTTFIGSGWGAWQGVRASFCSEQCQRAETCDIERKLQVGEEP